MTTFWHNKRVVVTGGDCSASTRSLRDLWSVGLNLPISLDRRGQPVQSQLALQVSSCCTSFLGTYVVRSFDCAQERERGAAEIIVPRSSQYDLRDIRAIRQLLRDTVSKSEITEVTSGHASEIR